MLRLLQARQFRCFETLSVELGPAFNFFIGRNGEGKTSLLEAACALLRLQSQRSSSLAPLVRLGQSSFSLAGSYEGQRLEFHYGGLRRRLLLDQVEQRSSGDYLRLGRVVSLANADIELVRGGGEARRRYLDFLGSQIEPLYRPALRRYERALRSRNALLRRTPVSWAQIEAYEPPLIENGELLMQMRHSLLQRLAPFAETAYREISAASETLKLQYQPGATRPLLDQLRASREEEARLRQTTVGPHRDELGLLLQGHPAQQFASEGQQRTIALALKIAQARVFVEESATSPLLLIDDIFGELDPLRRNRVFAALPEEAQKLVTATTTDWMTEPPSGQAWRISDRRIEPL